MRSIEIDKTGLAGLFTARFKNQIDKSLLADWECVDMQARFESGKGLFRSRYNAPECPERGQLLSSDGRIIDVVRVKKTHDGRTIWTAVDGWPTNSAA